MKRVFLKNVILLTIGVFMFVFKLALLMVPNLDLTILLMIVTTLYFGVESGVSVYSFLLLDFLFFGQVEGDLVCNICTWLIFILIIRISKKEWGLPFFGPAGFVFGFVFRVAISYAWDQFNLEEFLAFWQEGLLHDVFFGIGNLLLVLLLFKPLCALFDFIEDHVRRVN